MKVFYPDGTLCEDMESFLRFYSRSYFFSNSWVVEEKIKKILYERKKALDEEDLRLILAWKKGKIKYWNSKTENDKIKEIDYYSGWDKVDINNWKISFLGNKELDLKELKKALNVLEKTTDLGKYFEYLSGFSGLGNVCIITLISFNTRSAYPIYDKFADKAVQAAYKGISPLSPITVKDAKMTDLSKHKSLSEYLNYFSKIKAMFGDDCCRDRRVDQALWVYGHLFRYEGVKT